MSVVSPEVSCESSYRVSKILDNMFHRHKTRTRYLSTGAKREAVKQMDPTLLCVLIW